MKQSDLFRRLREAGCFLKRHGTRHDIWHSPKTGYDWPVPRHGAKEIPTGTLNQILEKLLGE
ncbi:MAG: type II toxin-antitoxin system HicA family toxin [Prevotella sp.]|nr:type II toxin-antitoxin system HicA family toxin [Prevotella sp.]MBQ9645264.1 type II toxin-antitoxin system HicA family toxin [Prevotella sp.]